MANVSKVSSTYNSITVQLINLDSSYNQETRYCHWYYKLSGASSYTYAGVVTLGNQISSGGNYTITSLNYNNLYDIKANVKTQNSGIDVTIGPESYSTNRVSAFSWTSSNGDATATQTRNAKSAVDNHGACTNFSYLVWNDMVNKLSEILTARGWSWARGSNNEYATQSNTLMSSNDKTMTALRFNSFKHNIGIHVSTGIDDVVQGAICYGHYFTDLVSIMNNSLR